MEYKRIIEDFEKIIFKIQYNLYINKLPSFIQHKDLLKYFLLKYLANYFNKKYTNQDKNKNNRFVIMGDYSINEIYDETINDIIFYDEDATELAARIIKKYLKNI